VTWLRRNEMKYHMFLLWFQQVVWASVERGFQDQS
jgi:hypothetical protein